MQLIRLIGSHHANLGTVVRKTLKCVEKDEMVEDGIHSIILLVDEMTPKMRDFPEAQENREKLVSNFRSKYNINSDIQVVNSSYGKE